MHNYATKLYVPWKERQLFKIYVAGSQTTLIGTVTTKDPDGRSVEIIKFSSTLLTFFHTLYLLVLYSAQSFVQSCVQEDGTLCWRKGERVFLECR